MVNRTGRASVACASIAFALCASRADAQLGVFFPGLGGNLSVVIPTEGVQDRWKVGFGGGLVIEPQQPAPKWYAVGEVGITRLLGKTTIDEFGVEQRTNDLSYWDFGLGVRRRLGNTWFVGVDAAYYVFSLNGSSGLHDQWGALPAVGFRAQGFGLTVRYKFVDDARWVQLRLSTNGFR